jgi:hypothetical protein
MACKGSGVRIPLPPLVESTLFVRLFVALEQDSNTVSDLTLCTECKGSYRLTLSAISVLTLRFEAAPGKDLHTPIQATAQATGNKSESQALRRLPRRVSDNKFRRLSNNS